MNDSTNGHTDDTDESSVTRSTHNRLVLIAVISVVAVLTIYIISTTLEQPQSQQTPQGAGQPMESADNEAFVKTVQEQIDHIREILSRDSSNVEAWRTLGNLYFDINEPEQAIVHYEAALALHPDDLNVKTDLATMQRAAGHPERAVELLKEVLTVDSTAAQAWFNLGVIYNFDLNNQRGALDAWKRYVALNPESQHADPVMREIERIEQELGGL